MDMNYVGDMILRERARERMCDFWMSASDLIILGLDLVAFKSSNKKIRTAAVVFTGLQTADKIRLMIANRNASKQAIEFINDEDVKKDAKEYSKLKSMCSNMDYMYQLTGKVK